MMKYVTTNWRWQLKDCWQQPLHFLGGALIVMGGCSMMGEAWWPVLVPASIVYGFRREWRQHAPVFIDVDSSFWTIGALWSLTIILPF